eukprot:403339033
MQNLSDKEKENALNEVRILASINHPNVIAYKEAFIDEASQSLCANLFLYKDMRAKLGDLNVSKVAKKGLSYTQTGTPYYASPEVWRDMPYDGKSDIWSLGCVCYEMCALKPPFQADDMQGLYKRVTKGVYPKIPTHFSQDMSNILKYMIQVSPQMRPSCDQILAHPVVEGKLKKYFPEYYKRFTESISHSIKNQDNSGYLLQNTETTLPSQNNKMCKLLLQVLKSPHKLDLPLSSLDSKQIHQMRFKAQH